MSLKGSPDSSVSAEKARELEKKYLGKWARFKMEEGEHGPIREGKILELWWGTLYHHGGPWVLECQFRDRGGGRFEARISQIREIRDERRLWWEVDQHID